MAVNVTRVGPDRTAILTKVNATIDVKYELVQRTLIESCVPKMHGE